MCSRTAKGDEARVPAAILLVAIVRARRAVPGAADAGRARGLVHGRHDRHLPAAGSQPALVRGAAAPAGVPGGVRAARCRSALVCTLLAIPAGTLAALALARFRLRWAAGLQVYLLLPFTIPLIVVGHRPDARCCRAARLLGQLWPVGLACLRHQPAVHDLGGGRGGEPSRPGPRARRRTIWARRRLQPSSPSPCRRSMPGIDHRRAADVHPGRQRIPGQPAADRRAHRDACRC